MPAYIIETVKLGRGLEVDVNVEITCTALCCPKYTRGLVVAAWVGEVFGRQGGPTQEPFIRIDYGAVREVRRLNWDGTIHNYR